MNFQDFLTKWNGKYIDFDGAYGNQCMDLMHQYCVEVLGISDGRVLAKDCAKNVYLDFNNTFGHEMFEQIANTPTGIPREGDIMFWGNSTYGHVAIFISGDVNNFVSFDQNYPNGSFCHPQSHTYANVLGWLRFKASNLQTELDQCKMTNDQIRKERDENWNKFVTLCTALGVGTNVDQAVIEIKKLVALEDSYNQKDKQLQEAQQKIAELDEKAQKLMIALNTVQDDLNVKQAENEELQKTVTDKVAEVKSLSASVQELTASLNTQQLSGLALIVKGIKQLFGWR